MYGPTTNRMRASNYKYIRIVSNLRHHFSLVMKRNQVQEEQLPSVKASKLTDDVSSLESVQCEVLNDDDEFLPNFVPTFAGYKCHFLRKDYYRTIKIFSPNVCFTKNDSLAVFRMAPLLRQRVAAEVETVLQTVRTNNSQCFRNPFSGITMENAIFLRLAPNCKYFYQKTGENAMSSSRKELEKRRCFSARLAICVKGAKVDSTGIEISPMLSVIQVLLLDLPKMERSEIPDECLLEEPVPQEDAPIEEDEQTMAAAIADLEF